MSKLNLTDLSNLQNEQTAVTAINANSAATETALENTLSRDGTAPNQMLAQLDMNSNRIINLPNGASNQEPVTVAQLSTLVSSLESITLGTGVLISSIVGVDFLSGFYFANNAFTPNTVYNVSAGTCTSDDFTVTMVLPSYTKTLSSWVVGSGSGSLDTGTISNSWYHGFIIGNPTTGAVDILISLSASSPTMPVGYTKKRRAFALFVDPSLHIIPITVLGDQYIYGAVTNISTTTQGTTPILYRVAVPTGIRVLALGRGYINHASTLIGVLVNSPDESPVAVNTPAGNVTALTNVVARDYAFGEMRTRTNTSGEIRVVSSASNTIVGVITYGMILPR